MRKMNSVLWNGPRNKVKELPESPKDDNQSYRGPADHTSAQGDRRLVFVTWRHNQSLGIKLGI